MPLLRRCLDGTGMVMRGQPHQWQEGPPDYAMRSWLGMAMGCVPCPETPSGPPECNDQCLGGTVKETAIATFSGLQVCSGCIELDPYGSLTVPANAILSGAWLLQRVTGTCRYAGQFGFGHPLTGVRWHQFNSTCSGTDFTSRTLFVELDLNHTDIGWGPGVGLRAYTQVPIPGSPIDINLFFGRSLRPGEPPQDCSQPVELVNEMLDCNEFSWINHHGSAVVTFD